MPNFCRSFFGREDGQRPAEGTELQRSRLRPCTSGRQLFLQVRDDVAQVLGGTNVMKWSTLPTTNIAPKNGGFQ